MPMTKSKTSLYGIEREQRESLQSFVNQFFAEASQMVNLNIDTAAEPMKQNYRDEKLITSMIKKPAESLDDHRVKAHMYAEVEKARKEDSDGFKKPFEKRTEKRKFEQRTPIRSHCCPGTQEFWLRYKPKDWPLSGRGSWDRISPLVDPMPDANSTKARDIPPMPAGSLLSLLKSCIGTSTLDNFPSNPEKSIVLQNSLRACMQTAMKPEDLPVACRELRPASTLFPIPYRRNLTYQPRPKSEGEQEIALSALALGPGDRSILWPFSSGPPWRSSSPLPRPHPPSGQQLLAQLLRKEEAVSAQASMAE